MYKIPFITIIFFIVIGCASLITTETNPETKEKKEQLENKLKQKTYHPFNWEEVE